MSLSPPFPPPQQPELLDPTASAGSLWRASRLAAFRDRAARSGLLPPPLSGDDGAGAVTTKSAAPETAADADADDGKTAAAASEEVASLLARAAELSSELDALASRQAEGKVQVPWWADGEYDDAAADAANDRGVEALRRWKRRGSRGAKAEEEKQRRRLFRSFPSSSSSSSSRFFLLFPSSRSRPWLSSPRPCGSGLPPQCTAQPLQGRARKREGRDCGGGGGRGGEGRPRVPAGVVASRKGAELPGEDWRGGGKL